MDRRGENLVRPLMLAIGLHIILLSTFFIAVSPEAKTITPPPVVVIQATELTFAPSAAAEALVKKKQAEEQKHQEELKKKAEAEQIAVDEQKRMEAEEEAAKDAEEAAWAAGADDREAEEVRNERNQLLLQTDWMASTDVTLSDAWRTYRQALRDVPAQSGFPNNVTWPTKPS